jgi:fucose permease
MNITTVVTISGALVFGIALGLSANLKRAVASRLDVGRPRLAALLGLLNVALLPALVVAGLLVDRWSVRGVMVLGSLGLALSLLALSERARYSRAVVALLGADCGAAAVCAASVVLMPHAFFRPGHGLAALQLGHAFIALGALLTPPLAGVLIHFLGLRRATAVLATLCLAPAFVAAAPTGGEIELARAGSASGLASLGSLFTDPTLWLLALFAFFYAPMEAGFNVWVARAPASPASDDERAADAPPAAGNGGLLLGFWAAFLLSRVLTAALLASGTLDPTWDAWGMVFLALLVLVALGNLAGSTSRASTPLGILAMGLLLGPIFPTLLGLAFRRFEAERGTTFALLFAVGSMGSLLWSRFVPVGENRPRPVIPWGSLALALGLVLAALVHVLLV